MKFSMRSSGFVFLSLLLHAGLLAVLVLAPTHIVSNEKPDTVEVQLNESADSSPEAPTASPEPAKAEAVAAASTPAPVPASPPAQKTAKAPRPHLAKAAPVVKASAPAVISTPAEPEEKADVATEEPKEDEAIASPEPEEKPELKPVVEKPTGVTADATPEETPEEKPEPIALIATAPVAGASSSGGGEQAGDGKNKGGATKEAAVSDADLRQMPGNKPPQYPVKARLENRQGNAELVYRVTKEGKVTDVQVAKSSGHADLDKEAVRAISQFKYVPGQEGWARHQVNFALKGQVVSLPSQLRGRGAQAD